jgi:hypothetical protein
MQEFPTTSLYSRLQLAEDTLKQSKEIDPALCYANTLMREVINPLEALNNLIFITKLLTVEKGSEMVTMYMEMAERQVACLNQITRKALGFCQEQHSQWRVSSAG